MNITFFGTYDTKTTPRVQAMIDGLRRHGIAVTECNAPLKLSTANRIAIARQPWKLPWLLLAIIASWLRLIDARRRLPATDVVIVGHLGQFDIHLARQLFRRQPLVLDYMVSGSDTARDRQVSGAIKNIGLVWLDNAALRTADIIVVDTEERRLTLPAKYRAKGVVVDVGAPQAWFDNETPPAFSTPRVESPLRVIFFGNYTPLQGAPIIGEALGLLRAPIEVTMVGDGQDRAETVRIATNIPADVTIKWTDWVGAGELPMVVAAHDVCLGIFGTSGKARQVVPNKVYQGAAVGCVIITSDTLPQRRALGETGIFVSPGDAKALAAALDRLARNPEALRLARQASYRHARRHFTPEKIVVPLLEKLSLPV